MHVHAHDVSLMSCQVFTMLKLVMSHVESCMPCKVNPRGSCSKQPAVGNASGAQSSDNDSYN